MRRLLAFTLYAAYFLQSFASRIDKRQSTKDNSDQYVLPVGSRTSPLSPPNTLAINDTNSIPPANFYNGESTASVTFDQHSVLLDGKVYLLQSPASGFRFLVCLNTSDSVSCFSPENFTRFDFRHPSSGRMFFRSECLSGVGFFAVCDEI